MLFLGQEDSSDSMDARNARGLLLWTSIPLLLRSNKTTNRFCWKNLLSETIAHARWCPGARRRNYAESTGCLHSNCALEQFEDISGNILGSARLFDTDSEAEYIHTESGAMTTLAHHVLYSCPHTLQPASFSTTKALNGAVLKWHFSLSRPESANRQINVKPKEGCYLNTANNQIIPATI